MHRVFGIDTPVMSFSVAKSVTNALLGILVRQGKVNMYAPAPVTGWQDPNDPRTRITPDNLLRMESGLDGAETGSGFDPASQMLYDSSDMGAFASRRRWNSRRPRNGSTPRWIHCSWLG
jgi:CubicO group peptidase (beta-lactamase class C family)